MYSLLRPLLFALEPERAHAFSFAAMRIAHQIGLLNVAGTPISDPVELFGVRFPNRIGIAAGLDKNATCVDALLGLGAGFVEIGTVTPKPQLGNPRPRVFRLPHARAIINRMGFPNDGMEQVFTRLQQRRCAGICGVNIGKNATTSIDNAADDYVLCLRKLAAVADYITVNVSSPNTVGLRSLQAAQYLRPMLEKLLAARAALLPTLARPLPLLVKIAPDLTDDEIVEIAGLLNELAIDGVIATNTTLSRPAGLGELGAEAGGLSGQPVHQLSLSVVRKLRAALGVQMPIIGVGGVSTPAEAVALCKAGADLVQVYTGLIYHGPALLRSAALALREGT